MSAPNNEEDGGVYFDPYDDQLINDYLLPKLNGEEDFEDFIVMKEVYDKEPWLLDHTKHPLFKKNEWFYFVQRTQVSQKNIGRGRKSNRRITGGNDGGNWKANVKKEIKDPETELAIGIKQTLTFKKSNDKQKKQKTGHGASVIVPGSDSTWTMYEYMLPGEDTFQELVLCKIKKSKTKDDDQPDESFPDSSSEQQPTNIDHQTVLAPSPLEQQQTWLCDGNGPEIPPMGYPSSSTCYAAETERIGEYSGEGNMVHQIDAFSRIEKVPERSSHKDRKFEDMEVTQEVDHQTVLAPSSWEQQQPLLCGGNGLEVPPMGYLSSSTCYDAETERIGEYIGEGNINIVDQIDAFSPYETVPERSSQKNGEFKALEVPQEDDSEAFCVYLTNLLMDDDEPKGLEDSVLEINTEDQQQPPIPDPAHMDVVAPVRLGDKSLPIEVDDDDEE